MTSEVETIMSGQVVRKVDADKAIGVSTANLMPDEKGEVPLSKQNAFEIPSQIVGPTPITQEGGLASTTPTVTEELDLNPSVPATPAAAATPTVSEVPTVSPVAAAPTAAVVNDVIKDNPVSVTSPTELGGLDIGSIIPNIPLVTDKPEQEAPVDMPVSQEVKLPDMPETVLAEEPTGVNDNLFVGTTSSVGEPVDSQPVVNGTASVPVATVAPEASVTETPVATLEDVSLNEPTASTSVEVNTGLEVKEPVNADLPISVTETEEIVESKQDVLPSISAEPANNVPVTSETVALDDSKDKENNNDEIDKAGKLDLIYNKLCEIDETLNTIKNRFEVEKGERDVEVEETKPAELPQTSEPKVPEIPSFVAPAEPVATQQEPKEEMVDALSQIGDTGISEVDETPIKGGMFI